MVGRMLTRQAKRGGLFEALGKATGAIVSKGMDVVRSEFSQVVKGLRAENGRLRARIEALEARLSKLER